MTIAPWSGICCGAVKGFKPILHFTIVVGYLTSAHRKLRNFMCYRIQSTCHSVLAPTVMNVLVKVEWRSRLIFFVLQIILAWCYFHDEAAKIMVESTYNSIVVDVRV